MSKTPQVPDSIREHYDQRRADERERHLAAMKAIDQDEAFGYFLTKGWVTVEEAAAWLSISERSVWNMVRENRITSKKVEGRRLISRASLPMDPEA